MRIRLIFIISILPIMSALCPNSSTPIMPTMFTITAMPPISSVMVKGRDQTDPRHNYRGGGYNINGLIMCIIVIIVGIPC